MTGVNGQTVTNAKIRLYNTDAASAGGKFYHVPDDTWQEETVTWNNAPTAETNLLAQLGAVSPNTWYEVDLTSQITGDGTYSFRISDSQGGADYSSREGANDPELVVTLGGTPAPTNTPPPVPAPPRPGHRQPPPLLPLRAHLLPLHQQPSTMPPSSTMAMASASRVHSMAQRPPISWAITTK